ncbi:MAG: hypothetical protein CMN82_10555 [Spongiibacter sp.]|nr:hypothetical protein [Spongiibacter sp.]MBI57558.1 hypothetical protein [Spongiibacter sp.]|tara:strand:+ start:772 stop:1575 length:804 start_codon:yes stop_codon:yes gene_type:complete
MLYPEFRRVSRLALLHPVARYLGVETNSTSHLEKWLSIVGSALGIGLASLMNQWLLGDHYLAWTLASMGASAGLIFAIPGGALSQPWPVLAGHLAAGAIGVASYRYLPLEWAVISATSLSVGAMYYLRCLHPPGIATAVFAVMGGDAIHAQGFALLLNPVLINATLLVLLGMLFNSVFPWRRYPRYHQAESAPQAGVGEQDIAAAMSRLDTFVDMSPEELLRVYQQAEQLAAQRRTSATVVRFPRRRQPTAINSDSQSDGNARRESR